MSQTSLTERITKEESIDLREYVRPVWQRKWLILAIVIIAGGGAFAFGKFHHSAPAARRYVSHSQVYIETADPASAVGPDSGSSTIDPPDGQEVGDQATLLMAQARTAEVYQRLKMPIGSAGTVTASPLSSGLALYNGTSILVVTATSRTAQLAARLANAYVKVYLDWRKGLYAQAAQSQTAAYQAQLAALPRNKGNASARQALEGQLAIVSTQAASPNAEAYQVAAAPVPAAPQAVSAPRSAAVDGVFGAVVGLMLGLALAFGLGLVDRRLQRVTAIERSYGREVLAVLSHVGEAAPIDRGQAIVPAPLLEALRALRINVQLRHGQDGPRTLLVTSAMPGEGKSSVARNLALVHAEGGDRVLLIDGDLRRPSVPGLFGIVDAQYGLTDVLEGTVSPGDAVIKVIAGSEPPSTNGHGPEQHGFGTPLAAPSHGSLDVLTHGQIMDNPVTLLASQAMETLLSSAGEHYDLVIIDSAPLLAVTDSVPLLSEADAVLIVARLGVTTRDAAERLNETIARVPHAFVVGVVANDMRATFLETGHGGMYSDRYGGYGYGYHGASNARNTPAKTS